MIRVTVWNENRSEQLIPEMKGSIPTDCTERWPPSWAGERISRSAWPRWISRITDYRTVLNTTDVMLWWGHGAHGEVPELAKVADQVLCGMGIIFLHSAHYSKPLQTAHGHQRPALAGRHLSGYGASIPAIPSPKAPPYFELEKGRDVRRILRHPQPDELVFNGWFRGGELFLLRLLLAPRDWAGVLFSARPRNQPHLPQPVCQRVLVNAVGGRSQVNWRNQLDAPCQEKPVEAMHADGETLTGILTSPLKKPTDKFVLSVGFIVGWLFELNL